MFQNLDISPMHLLYTKDFIFGEMALGNFRVFPNMKNLNGFLHELSDGRYALYETDRANELVSFVVVGSGGLVAHCVVNSGIVVSALQYVADGPKRH